MKAQVSISIASDMLRKERDLYRWVPIYTGCITAWGVLVIVKALTRLPVDQLGLLCFAVIASVAELFSVELFVGTRGSRVSVSSIIATASILTFGPLAGALTHMAAGIMTPLTTTLLQREEPQGGRASLLQRSAFNMSMWVIATTAAGWVYTLAGGTIGHVAQLSNILPLLAAAFADVVINLTLLIVVLTLQTGKRPLHIWHDNFRWSTPISVLGGVIGGGALALAYEMFALLGLAAFFLPVLSTGYSFRLYISNMKDTVNRLEEANRSLDEANVGLLETLGAIIDADDVYTFGHSTQVAVYAIAIAEKMNLPEDQQASVIKAALIHDVGKVGVMDSIIGKQGPLTHDERNMVKRHPIIGAEIVGRMKGLQDLVPAVRHHHEYWEGSQGGNGQVFCSPV